MSSESYIKRTTLFQIPKEENQDAVIKQYEVLRRTALKVVKSQSRCHGEADNGLLGWEAVYRVERVAQSAQYFFPAERGLHDCVAINIQDKRGP